MNMLNIKVKGNSMYPAIKRIFDVLAAAAGLIILLPLFLIVAAVIKGESKGAVFFRQKRIGKDKCYFYIYKFRTMRVDTPKDVPTHLMTGADSYITRTGGFLRKTSLDELPQLINILKGEMSFVGPRPALWNQDDLVALRDLGLSNGCVPGLTGLAQIKGRDELPIEVKARFDNEYAEKMGLWLDVKIVFVTAVKAVLGDGVREGGVK